MAELTDIQEQINKLQEAFNGLGLTSDAQARLFGQIGGLTDLMRKANVGAGDLGKMFQGSFHKAQESIAEALDVAGLFQETMAKITSKIYEAGGSTENFGAKAALALGTTLGLLRQNNDLFGELGRSGTTAGSSIGTAFQELSGRLEKIPGGKAILDKFAPMIQAADAGQRLEDSLLQVASASGQFSDVLKITGPDLARMPDYLSVYSDWIDTSAGATGKLSTEVAKAAEGLVRIPGAMEGFVEVGTAATRMNLLTAALKVASGTGQDQKAVIDQMTAAYRDFGVTGQKALEFVAKLSRTAQETHTPFDIMESTVKGMAGSFKLMGDNLQSAISIMSDFSAALKDSGLGPTAIAEIASTVTSGIAKMDVAHRAFVSSATGGPGGLQGAFQLKILEAQGRTDEVNRLVQEAVSKQFGGKAVSFEESGQSQEKAAQFFKQVTFVQEFLGADEDHAIGALRGGFAGGAPDKAKESPQQALQAAVETGTEIQKAQANKMTEAVNVLHAVERHAAISALAEVRIANNMVPNNSRVEVGKRMSDAAETGGVQAGSFKKGTVGQYEARFDRAGDQIDEIFRDYMPEAINDLYKKSMQRAADFTKGMTAPSTAPISSAEGLAPSEQLMTAAEASSRRSARQQATAGQASGEGETIHLIVQVDDKYGREMARAEVDHALSGQASRRNTGSPGAGH